MHDAIRIKHNEVKVMKERADKLVVKQGLAANPHKAQALIMAGLVFLDDQRVNKPGQLLEADQSLKLKATSPYVSRGGMKLEKALEIFDIAVAGKIAADLGSSTGGFTDCLLQKGALKVYSVDVDIRQIDWHLSRDSRVVLIRKNARYLVPGDFPDRLQVITMDLSFISILKVLLALKAILGKGTLVVLIKPQFEVEKQEIGRKGIVRDPALHEAVLNRIAGEALSMGFGVNGVISSPILGQKGNREFFFHWSLEKSSLNKSSLSTRIKEVVWDEKN